MTLDRTSSLVAGWVRLYTKALPAPVAERRLEEIAADVHDHIAWERTRGTSDWRIALGVISRMARGMPADLAWGGSSRQFTGERMKPFVAALVIAIGLAVVALILDSPALVLLSVLVIVGTSVATFARSVRTAWEGGFVVPFVAVLAGALAVTALGITAIVVGERGDAPGLVLLGTVLIGTVVVGAFALGTRSGQRTM